MSGKLALIPIGLLILVAGCSAGHNAESSSAPSAGANLALPATEPSGAAAGSAAGSGDAQAKTATTPLQTRDIVRTATLDVTVGDVDRAADAAVSAAIAAGGRADADDRTTSGQDRHAHLVLRVPSARLTGLMDSIARGGHPNSSTDHGDDVSAATADVGARVEELRISVGRLQDFLSRSGSIGDLVSLETQLTQRESELASTIAQQRALADQVSLGTLTVDLSATAPPVAKKHHGPAGFGSAIVASLHGLYTSLKFALAGAGYLIPFAVVLVPLGFVLWRLGKRRRASRAAGAAAATP